MSPHSAAISVHSPAPFDFTASVVRVMDSALREMTSEGAPPSVMDALVTRLGDLWLAMSRDEWAACRRVCQRHPLYELLGQDPFTRRARDKPRGYAGDAVMIDYIYRGLPEAEVRYPLHEDRSDRLIVAGDARAHGGREDVGEASGGLAGERRGGKDLRGRARVRAEHAAVVGLATRSERGRVRARRESCRCASA